MDRDRQRYWLRYACDLARRMELRDWTIGIADDPADDDCFASVNCAPMRKRATISLSLRFDMDTPQEQRHAITHELIHCHLANADTHINDALYGGGKLWMRQLATIVHTDHEFAIDALADVIGPFMPLPPDETPKTGKKKHTPKGSTS